MKIILKAENLCKNYKRNKHIENIVLKNINLEIREGEFVSLMGASGSGKSTLLYNLSGMGRISSGKVLFNNENISKYTETELAELRLTKMGFIFQQTQFLKNLNILDNIILPGYASGLRSEKQVLELAKELMCKMRIEHISHNDITQISGGELQRAGICRALINNPDIIFGDEPTGALNSKYTKEIMKILLDINSNNKTILLVTHDPKVAVQTDRVLFMIDGEITNEIVLGKNKEKKEETSKREEIFSKWLKEKDF